MTNERLFKDESIGKLILKTSIPSVMIIIMMMIYNMADIFFIGQLGDARQVAAVSLVGPVMSILSGLGTLVGSGGCAAIAMELGKGNKKRVRSMSSFCCWVSIGLGLLFTIVVLVFMTPILNIIGTSENTFEFAKEYLGIIVIGAPFTIFSSVLANVVRAQGAIKESMIGNISGNLVDLILNPLLISTLEWGIKGAAISTVIGSVVSTLYFLKFILGKRSELSINPKEFSFRPSVSLKVLSLGMPTAISVILMSISSMIRNNVAVGYGDIVIAASGVAGRVSMLAAMIQMGICMGVQPALAYNFGASKYKRLDDILKRMAQVTIVTGVILTAVVFLGRVGMVEFFLNDPEVTGLASYMVALTIVTGPVFGISQLSTTYLQSTDKASLSTLTSLLRQGLFLLPLTFLFNVLFGLYGFIWSSAVSDVLATIVILVMFVKHRKKVTTLASQLEMEAKLGMLDADASELAVAACEQAEITCEPDTSASEPVAVACEHEDIACEPDTNISVSEKYPLENKDANNKGAFSDYDYQEI